MSFNKLLLVSAVTLVSCGKAADVPSSMDSEVSSAGGAGIQVQCRKFTEGSRGLTIRDSISFSVDGKNVKLSRLLTTVTMDKSSTVTQSITGTINSVFDGTVVKSTHATVLLNPTLLTSKSAQGMNERKLNYVLIEYSGSQLRVLDPESKPIMVHGICRTLK